MSLNVKDGILQISCFIKEQPEDIVNLSWRWSMSRCKNSSYDENKYTQYFLYKKLDPVFSCFEDWVTVQEDCPRKGHVGTATIAVSDFDENDALKVNGILDRLKENYRLAIICRQMAKEDRIDSDG